MTAGALYHHFASKQELFAAVFRRHQAEAFSAFEVAVAAGGGFVEQLSAVLDVPADMASSDRGLAGFTAVATVELKRNPVLRALAGEASREEDVIFVQLLSVSGSEIGHVHIECLSTLVVAEH